MSRFLPYIALGTIALILGGCPSSSRIKMETQTSRVETIEPAIVPSVAPTHAVGNPYATGFTHQPVGSQVSYRVMDVNALPQWHHQQFESVLAQFMHSCSKLYQHSDWRHVCQQATQVEKTNQASKQFFEQNFTAWQVADGGKLGGTITGYYIPVISGSLQPTSRARFPIYGIPNDMVSVVLPAHLRGSKNSVRIKLVGTGKATISQDGAYLADLSQFPINERTTVLKGRFEGQRFVPYPTRRQINAGALNGKATILAYADDPVELFFMHIQGSGHVRTPDGKMIHLGFADTNEHPFVGIGKYLSDKGYLPMSQMSMQNIKKWIAANPHKMAEVLGQNPRYVFFRELSGSSGSLGALGVPLAGTYSGAVDRRFITLGAPIFVATVHPDTRQGLNRLIVAQDTGAAIKGGVRVDFFWGYGERAGQTAGKMKDTGYVWQLLPHGVLPQYQP